MKPQVSAPPGGVVALLPNAGLANKLFAWGKAEVFAHLNGATTSTIGWSYPKIGPMLRGEKSMRLYGSYFRSQTVRALRMLAIGRLLGTIRSDPPCVRLETPDPRAVHVFRSVPHWSDRFGDIREHRAFLRERLLATVRPEVLRLVADTPQPVLGVHIRHGDFRPLRPGENFREVGHVRTPDAYFLDVVQSIRTAAGSDVPVTIFSDGTDDDLAYLLDLPRVARAPATNDVADLLLLSCSRVIVTSAGSTFSDWAGYLSDADLIRHPDHIHTLVRPAEMQTSCFEGPPPDTPAAWQRIGRSTRNTSRSWLSAPRT